MVTEIGLIYPNPQDSIFCLEKTGSFPSNIVNKYYSLCKLEQVEQGLHMVWIYGCAACFISWEQQNLGQTCWSMQCLGQGVESTSSRIQNETSIHVFMMTACIMAEPAYPLPWWIMKLFWTVTDCWQQFDSVFSSWCCKVEHALVKLLARWRYLKILEVPPLKVCFGASCVLYKETGERFWLGWRTAIFCRSCTCSQLLQLGHGSRWGCDTGFSEGERKTSYLCDFAAATGLSQS